MSSARLTPEQMVEVLRNPSLLLQDQATPGATTAAAASAKAVAPITDHALTKILKEIELAIEQGSLSLAQQLVQIVDRWDLEIAADQQAWFLYHKGCLQLACGERDAGFESLRASLQRHESSWCHYKLAELCSEQVGGEQDFDAYRHYQRALSSQPPLSQEAEAHASNWLNGFFEAAL